MAPAASARDGEHPGFSWLRWKQALPAALAGAVLMYVAMLRFESVTPAAGQPHGVLHTLPLPSGTARAHPGDADMLKLQSGRDVSSSGLAREAPITPVIPTLVPPAPAEAAKTTCGTSADRLRCVAATHPVFDDRDCSKWTCDAGAVATSAVPCCVRPYSRDEMYRLLKGAVLVFVGDSTSRRTNYQLQAFLKGKPFTDPVYHHILRETLSQGDASFITITHWMPHPENLTEVAGKAVHGLFQQDDTPRRKVFIVTYSTHEYVRLWKNTGPEVVEALLHGLTGEMEAYVARVSAAVQLLKSSSGVNLARDIVLFRLPIAEACDGGKYYSNHCNATAGLDPINTQMHRLQEVMKAVFARDHPDVGLLELMSWTWAASGVGRTVCTPSDDGGTHFGTDIPRLAYVNQIVHAVAMLSQGKEGWDNSGRDVIGCVPSE